MPHLETKALCQMHHASAQKPVLLGLYVVQQN